MTESKDLYSESPGVASDLKAELTKWQSGAKAVIPTDKNENFDSTVKESKKRKKKK